MAWKLSDEKKIAVVEAYIAGVKLIAIAAEFGIHHSTPGQLAKRRGIPLRRGQTRASPRTKLTDQQKIALTACYIRGDRIKHIAHHFGITAGAVGHIAHRRGALKRYRTHRESAAYV